MEERISPDTWAEGLDGDGRWLPTCRATTGRGTRCRNALFCCGNDYDEAGRPTWLPGAREIYETGVCSTHARTLGV